MSGGKNIISEGGGGGEYDFLCNTVLYRDPCPALSEEKNLKYFIIIRISHQKKSIER